MQMFWPPMYEIVVLMYELAKLPYGIKRYLQNNDVFGLCSVFFL